MPKYSMMIRRTSLFSTLDSGFGAGLAFGGFTGNGSFGTGSEVTIPCRILASL
jgi:hypothetical protein